MLYGGPPQLRTATPWSGERSPNLNVAPASRGQRRCAVVLAVRASQQQQGGATSPPAAEAVRRPRSVRAPALSGKAALRQQWGGSSSAASAQQGRQKQQEPPADESEAALILLACGVGVATGGAIVLFNLAIHWIRDALLGDELVLAGTAALRYAAEGEAWPKVVFPPLLGGLAVGGLGLLVGGYEDRPGSSAPGGEAAAFSVRQRASGILRPVARAIAATVTLGTGASLGPEGPSVDIGRSLARALSVDLRSRQRHLTSLLAAGSGAGVAAGFNAPISGVFFAVETVLQKRPQPQRQPGVGGEEGELSEDSRGLAIAMVLLASVLAALVSQAGLGSSPAFRVPAYRLESLYELPLYLAFGTICGVVSASFTFSTRVAVDAFDELRQENPVEAALMPAIGGLTTGVLALGYPEILYQGFDNVNSILSSDGEYAPGMLVQIVVIKIIATSICRGSGLQGGLYAPSIFIGAALGTAFGGLAHAVADPAGVTLAAPQAYALVGVAAMLASNCGVPLTSVLLLFELTRDYYVLVPTMAAVGLAFWVSGMMAPRMRGTAARRMGPAPARLALDSFSAQEAPCLLEGDSSCFIVPVQLGAAAALRLLQCQGPEVALLPSPPASSDTYVIVYVLTLR